MATTAAAGGFRARQQPVSILPVPSDYLLAAAAALLMAAVLAALYRGRVEWGSVPAFVWLHLATIMVALMLTPVMLLRPRGDRLHRRTGYIWVAAMFATALLSFGIRSVNRFGGLSFIHILSAWVMLQMPVIVWTARTHRVHRHRRAVRAMVIGALLTAGFFTFPFQRLLGHWLFR